MSDPFAHAAPSRIPLFAAFGLALVAVVLVAAIRLGIASVPSLSHAKDDSVAVATRALRFEDLAPVGVAVVDADSGARIATLASGGDGFVRATVRSLARERKQHELGAAQAFRLTAYADGRLTLEDPATGRIVDLEAFGPTNAAAFARFLPVDRHRLASQH